MATHDLIFENLEPPLSRNSLSYFVLSKVRINIMVLKCKFVDVGEVSTRIIPIEYGILVLTGRYNGLFFLPFNS